MNQIWIGLIVLAVLATAGFLISLIIELRKSSHSLMDFLRTTDESIKTTLESTKATLEELQQTLKSLRSVSDDVKDITGDVKTLSGAMKDTGQNIKHISKLIEDVTLSTVIKTSGLRAGIKTALEVLVSNLFLKKGGRQ